MRDLLKPLLLVLAVPVLVTAVSMVGRSDWESRWRATLVHQLAAQRMRPDEPLLSRYSLPTLCGDPRTAARLPPCGTYVWYSSVIRLSAVAGGAGFLFLGTLLGAGALLRGSRGRFARMFRPAVVYAAAGTGILGLANAALAVGAVLAVSLYLLGNPIEGVSVSLLLIAGTAAAVWGIGMFAAAFSVTRRPAVTVVGRRVAAAGQSLLVEEARAAALAVGARPPSAIVACLAPSMFVSELNVTCLDGTVSGRTLCLSLPLCRILAVGEFRALLAHELAHFAGAEENYSRGVAPFFGGAARAIETLGRQSRGIRALAVVPPRELLSFFLGTVSAAGAPEAGREFEADQLAAGAFGAEELGAALVKAQAFAPAWYTVAGAMVDAVSMGTQYVNASRLFEEVVAANTAPERLRGIGRRRLEHPTDLHPTLVERLAALGLDVAAVAKAALITTPAQPSIALIAGHDELEQGLSAAEHQLIAATGGEAIGSLPV